MKFSVVENFSTSKSVVSQMEATTVGKIATPFSCVQDLQLTITDRRIDDPKTEWLIQSCLPECSLYINVCT